jgi:hypothetical protein
LLPEFITGQFGTMMPSGPSTQHCERSDEAISWSCSLLPELRALNARMALSGSASLSIESARMNVLAVPVGPKPALENYQPVEKLPCS